MSILFQYKNKSNPRNKREFATALQIIITWKYLPQYYYIVHLKSEGLTLKKNIFLRIYWDLENKKIKEGNYDYCKSN